MSRKEEERELTFIDDSMNLSKTTLRKEKKRKERLIIAAGISTANIKKNRSKMKTEMARKKCMDISSDKLAKSNT